MTDSNSETTRPLPGYQPGVSRKKTEAARDLSLEERLKKISHKLEASKAEDIRVLDLGQVSDYLQYFVLATANSETHLRALARELTLELKQHGESRMNPPEPGEEGWVVLDYVDIVVQLFTEQSRQFYKLDKLWADASDVSQQYLTGDG